METSQPIRMIGGLLSLFLLANLNVDLYAQEPISKEKAQALVGQTFDDPTETLLAHLNSFIALNHLNDLRFHVELVEEVISAEEAEFLAVEFVRRPVRLELDGDGRPVGLAVQELMGHEAMIDEIRRRNHLDVEHFDQTIRMLRYEPGTYHARIFWNLLDDSADAIAVVRPGAVVGDTRAIFEPVTSAFRVADATEDASYRKVFRNAFGRRVAEYFCDVDPYAVEEEVDCTGVISAWDAGPLCSADSKGDVAAQGNCCKNYCSFMGSCFWPAVEFEVSHPHGGKFKLKVGSVGWSYYSSEPEVRRCVDAATASERVCE